MPCSLSSSLCLHLKELGIRFPSFNIVVRNIVPYVRPMSIGGYDDEAYEGKNERHVGGRKTKI